MWGFGSPGSPGHWFPGQVGAEIANGPITMPVPIRKSRPVRHEAAGSARNFGDRPMRQWLAGTRRVAGRSWVWCAAVLALALVAGPALAVGPGGGPTGGGGGGGGGTGGGGGGTQVPEINPGSAA